MTIRNSTAHGVIRSPWLALVVLALATTATADPVDWSGYTRSFDITFPGYTGSETLTDFPVLVRLSAARNDFQYAKCKLPDGGDLRFSDAEGNLLAHEIDTWNPDGESLVWVKVPSLNASTKITAHYSCSTPVAVTPSDVWSNGYAGVWHFDEENRQQLDSTANGQTLKGHATYSANMAFGSEGSVGKAVELSTTEDSHGGGFEVSDSSSLYTGTKTLTVEIWARHRKIAGDKYIFRLKNSKSENSFAARFSWPVYGGDDTKTQINYSSILTNLTAGTRNEYGDVKYQIPTNEIVNVWRHYALVVDNETLHRLEAFQNGVSKKTQSIADEDQTIWAGGGNLLIGNTSASQTQAFPGTLDEVRISRVARSATWLKATYDTVTDEDFAAYEQPNDWKSYTHTFSVSFPGATNGELSAFPVLVKLAEGSPNGFSYAHCLKPDGGDLRFADEDGNILASEVDTWNPAGVSTVWVNVPSLSSTTSIKAYYGWAFAPSVDSKNVWTNGYVGVWHLGESARPLKDSSVSGLHFARSSRTASKPAEYEAYNAYGADDSAVGRAMKINPAVNGDDDKKGGLYADDPDSLIGGFSAMTVEIWAKSEGEVSSRTQTLFTKRLYGEPKKNIATFLYDTSFKPISTFEFQNNGTTNKLSATGNALDETARGQWKYHVATFDMANTVHTNYLNAAEDVRVSKNMSSWGDHIATTDGLCLGNRPTPGNLEAFSGLLDELRISNVARSPAWVKATYDTIVNNATFTHFSAVKENTLGTVLLFR